MASYVICHGHAHRLTAMGIIESTPVLVEGDTIGVDAKGWIQRLPESIDMTGGDYVMIQDMLTRLTQNFQGDGTRLPSSEGQPPTGQEPNRVL